jgi:hypothetical protein
MASIYITENLYNKALGITPWRYMGSDQNDNPVYFGSSADLKADILRLGVDNFTKIIVKSYNNITNKELRKIEADLLKTNNVKKDPSYYNKTDIYGPGGGIKGMKHSSPRSAKYLANWSASRIGHKVSDKTKKLQSEARTGKTYEEIHGEDNAKGIRKKQSEKRSGGKNPNALTWKITSPTGNIITISGLKAYCRENNISFRDVYYSKNGWKSVKFGTGKGGGRKKKEKND